MKNANNEAITIPHEIFINNPENIESEVATFISYLPELMSEVTATAIPTIIDLKVTCGDKTSTIKLPIIPFNFKTNTPKDLDDFVRIASTPNAKKYNKNVNHQMLQTRYNAYINDAFAYIMAQISSDFENKKAPINAKHAHAHQTKTLALKDKFQQMLNAIEKYNADAKPSEQPSNS